MMGRVYLVGAGPGDPGLLTVRGAEVLQRADAVVYDTLVNPALLEWARPGAKRIYVGKDVHHRGDRRYVQQEKTNRLLVSLARRGDQVVRLKGGDPFVFGRGGEEASYLRKHGISFEVVPGISAGIGAPAYAGIPITDRRLASVVAFVTAHPGDGKKGPAVDWPALAKLRGTLVLFMGVGNLKGAARSLVRNGKSPHTPVSVIEWATLPRQRVIEGTLKDIVSKVREAGAQSPSVVVIGEVNRFRKELAWYGGSALLRGKTVLITRARAQAGSLRTLLEERGARVLEFPALRILPPKDFRPLDRVLLNLSKFDWVVFTSANGVRSVMERLEAIGGDARFFQTVHIAVVGEATQEALRQSGLGADFVPSRFTTARLLEELGRKVRIDGRRFLLLRTDIASPDLARGLEALGGKVTEVTAYRTVPERGNGSQRKWKAWFHGGDMDIDYVTFASSSAAENFFRVVPRSFHSKLRDRCVSIGPVTSGTLRSHNMVPVAEAREHTIPGMINAITEHAAMLFFARSRSKLPERVTAPGATG